MKVVVAGGAGMIGSNIATLLSLAGEEPLIADLAPSKYFKTDLPTMDFRDRQTCLQILNEADEVYNCAAPTKGIGYSGDHHAEMFTHTAQIAFNLIDAAAYNRVKRFLLVSSSCVYPDNPMVIPTPEDYITAAQPEEANLGYGWGKRVAERQVQFYTSQMHIVIVRPPNVYGPSYNWDNPDKHVIPALIERMLRGDNPLVVWGNGNQTRSFIYEDDVADLSVKLLRKGMNGEAYNLGGHEIYIAELAHLIADICRYQGRIIFDPGAPVGPKRKALSTEKLNKVIGKYDYTPLRTGLIDTIQAARGALRFK